MIPVFTELARHLQKQKGCVVGIFTSYYYNKSEACKRITDGLDVAMESASIDSMGIFSVVTSDGHLFIPMEEKLRKGIKDLMRNW